MLSSHFWIIVALTSVAVALPRPQSQMGGRGGATTVATTVATTRTTVAGNATTARTTTAAGSTTRAANTTAATTTIIAIPWAYCCPGLTLFWTPTVTPVVLQYSVIFPFFQGWFVWG